VRPSAFAGLQVDDELHSHLEQGTLEFHADGWRGSSPERVARRWGNMRLIWGMQVSASCEHVQLAYELSNVRRSFRAEMPADHVKFCVARHLITDIDVKIVLLCKKLFEVPHRRGKKIFKVPRRRTIP
jgi:hypothetical protein